MKSPFPGFPPETLKFLKQLKRNNNRPWFQAHKALYEEKVKRPMEELVLALGGPMQSFAPDLVTDPKRAIFRIYRDTRFSPDKTPYKPHIAAHFSPRSVEGAGLYFQIDPEEVLIAGGIYMPGGAELRAIRNHIAGHSEELRAILKRGEIKKLFGGLQGDQLSRAPRGFPQDHPALDLLKRKSLIVWFTRPSSLAEGPRLFPLLLESFIAVMPLVRYLNKPLKNIG